MRTVHKSRASPVASAGIALLAAVGLAWALLALAAPADDSPTDLKPGAAPADSSTGKPRAHGHPLARRRIDDDMLALTRTLDLDTGQQARLRELLVAQQREIREVWTRNASPEADRTGPTLAIIERTKEQIRAMLNEEQKKKYSTAVPKESLAPAQADIEHWLSLTHPKDQKGDTPGN